MMATRPPVDGSQYNERRETSAGVSDFFTPDSMQNHNMTYSELNCMSETILGGGVNSAGSGLTNVDTTLQWVSQVSQNMQTERQSFQRQLQGLQKHNKRYVERNVAFSNGLSGMDKALRVHAQRLLGEVSHYLSTLSGGEQSALESATAATRHHLAQLQESLQRAVPITPSSNPRAIAEAFDQMDSILSNMMATQQSISALSARSFTTIRRDSVLSERSTLSEFRSLPTQNTVLYRETQPGPDINGGNLRSGDTSLGATVNAMKSPPPSGYLGDETGPTGLLSEDRLASIASPDQAEIGQLPTVSASRLVEMVTDEVSQSERHVLDLKAAWNHIEGMRKVSYLPYREQQKPDLRKDFMQFVVLWDLMQAHELIDFAREECNFCMMEVVLKANDNGCFGGQFPFAAVYKSAAEKGRVQEEVNKEATRVVNLSIDLEVSVKRIRRTFERQQSAISADLKTNPAVKGFVAMNPSPSVNERLMQGVLYWCHVCLHLLCECFECVEELICPREESSAYINKDNFLLIQNRLADWGNIVEEIERLVSQCRAGLQYIHHAASQTRQRANSTKPEDQNAADEDGEEEEEAQESESYSFFRFEGNGLRPIVFSIYAQYIVATKSFPKILDTPKNRSSSPRVSTVGAGLDGGEGHYSTLADSEALLAEVIAEMDTVLKKCSVLDTYCGILQRHVETILGSQRRGISEEDGKGEDVFVSVSQDNDTNNNSNTSAPPEGTTNNGSLTGSKEGGTELTSSMPNTANHSSNGGAISEAEARKMLELFANEPNDTRRASISDSNMRIQYGEESYLHPHQLLNAALKESCKMTQADPPPASEEGDGRSASNGASFLGGSLNRKGSAVDLMSPLKIKSASPMTHTSTTSSSPTATERSGSNATKKTPQLGLLNTRRSFS
ncbi:hypothetical protein AGDE_14170 [Angomonas deanei]|uniref:Uncharacterized protein n=1 Tax=Angomonas deanei TaxID=59799 RepID=A0A7G2CMP9_9TRYP|nr:hypothetical protein AGDE_14170 [Angomonas deanei]CAD2219542.1 hypothetical protein, conserved [Angomonas deanei]|eukprot:EPY21252.1 hypothetical protein AGDE_14170 [Angomonas deanei]